MRTVIIREHAKNCLAVRFSKAGKRPSPWSPVVADTERHNRNGVGRGQHYWLRFICNDIACHGELLVSVEDVLKAVPQA